MFTRLGQLRVGIVATVLGLVVGALAPQLSKATHAPTALGVPISSLPFTVSSCGSYYLTKCLTGVAGQDGITVTADGVTLDLSGFTLSGVPGSLTRIVVNSGGSTIIRNGHVMSWGANGIKASGANTIIEDVISSNNGINGIEVGPSSIVRASVAESNGNDGIDVSQSSVVDSCTSWQNGNKGYDCNRGLLRGCSAWNNAFDGFEANESLVISCTAGQNAINYDVPGSTVINVHP